MNVAGTGSGIACLKLCSLLWPVAEMWLARVLPCCWLVCRSWLGFCAECAVGRHFWSRASRRLLLVLPSCLESMQLQIYLLQVDHAYKET